MAHYKGVANDQPMQDSKHMSRCALNPMTMDGGKYDLKPAKRPKTIAVVGGGVGGMEVARVATMRGHKVTIYENRRNLAECLSPAGKMSFKERDRMLLNWYRRQIEKLGIEVKLNSEITDLKQLKADEIVIATGSRQNSLKSKTLKERLKPSTF